MAIDVTQVRYGKRATRRSEAFHEYAQYGEPDAPIEMDYSYWVIRSPDGLTLLDTGYDILAHDWLGEVSVMPPPQSLALLGIAPDDVDTVIASHFHYDHIGYIGSFPRARIVAGRAEYDHWFGALRADALDGEFSVRADLEAIERAEADGRVTLVDEPTEVSPGITVHPAGGHSPGQLVTLVGGPTPLVLTSDAAHLSEQVTHGWPFFAHSSLEGMRASQDLIVRLAAEHGAEVIPGHDSRVRLTHPAVEGPASAVATVLAR